MSRPSALPARFGAALLAVALLGPAPRLHAQTVVEVQGGGSSLLGGYGATANFWRNGVDGWFGLGYLHGLRAGAFLRTGLKRDTLRIGNDALVVRFPTDVFGAGYNILVQGASYTGGTERSSYLVFAGASSSGLGAPSFQPTDIESPLGAVFLQHRLSPSVRLTSTTIFARRQTFVPGVQWQISPDLSTALAAGIGADRPYAASSVLLRKGDFDLKASYAWNPGEFHRVAVPTPIQTETDRENIQLTYQLSPDFAIGVGRQNFVQDSLDDKPPVRASGNSVFAGGRWQEIRLTAGLYDSRSQSTRNLSSYFAVGRELTRWLDAELFVLQSRPQDRPANTTPVANLRWKLSPKLGLVQQISVHEGRTSIQFGANIRTAIGEFGADYQIVHQPFQPLNPFRSALNLTARLQLGSYSTSIGTYLQPDGSVDYAASGSTFLYMGSFGGVQPQQVGGTIGRYVVRGLVKDEAGEPVEGAAVELGGELAFTNSTGEFFVRVRRPNRYPVSVRLDEFLLPGHWEVVTAPSEVQAQPEERAGPLEIILHRVTPPAPTPLPVPPADSAGVPAPSADTLMRTAPPPAPAVTEITAAAPPLFSDSTPVLVLREVRFESGKAVMLPRSLPVLDSIARGLLALPDVRVEITGYTDSSGIYRRNLTLSQARAEAVRLYLQRQGVALERMVARGFGPSRPVASNRTAAGRAQNRRVEMRRLAAGETVTTAAPSTPAKRRPRRGDAHR